MIEIIILGGLVMLFSAFIKGISGFGTAIFAVPLLTAFFFLPAQVRVIVVSLNLLLNVFILSRERNLTKQNLYEIRWLMIPGFLFAFITGFFLATINDRFFAISLGVLLIITAINKLFDFPYKIQHVKRYFPAIGSLSGILNTLIGVGGIPVLIYLSNTTYQKSQFRMTLMLFFMAINTGSVLTFIINGAYTSDIVIYTFSFVPFVLAGSLVGMTIVRFINNKNFNKIVAVLLLFMGLTSLFDIL